MTEPEKKLLLRDMPWDELRKLLRIIGPEIARLAARGDKFASRVKSVYEEACRLPIDHPKNRELRIAIEDYVKRDLEISERRELQSRFGHLVEEKPTGPRIVVPGSIRRQ